MAQLNFDPEIGNELIRKIKTRLPNHLLTAQAGQCLESLNRADPQKIIVLHFLAGLPDNKLAGTFQEFLIANSISENSHSSSPYTSGSSDQGMLSG